MKKKLMAGLLSLVMMLSMVMPAFAAGPTTSTIDTNLKGSITINKKETNDGVNTPLAGVTFKIYKIADIVQTKSANGEVEVTLDPIEALGDDFEITADTTYADVSAELDLSTLTAAGTATTDAKGKVVFSKLDLGVYLVVETDAPAQIVEKSANFLVSVPMTNAAGTQWVYDITAEPKNVPVREGINLVKYGKVGNNEETTLDGAKFELQQMVNTSGVDEWVKVTKDSKGNVIGDEKNQLTTADGGKISVTDLAPGTYRFVEVETVKGYILDAVSTFQFRITDSGEVSFASNVDTVQIGGTKEDPVFAIKVVNEKPDLEKEVWDDDAWKEAADAAKDEPVRYLLTVDVPTNVAALKTFTLEDTMEHQTFEPDSLKIYSDVTCKNEILAGQYTVTPNTAVNNWSIAFNSNGSSILANEAGERLFETIYVEFYTNLTDDAVTTSEGNENTVKVIYSNVIDVNGTPTTNYIEDDAKVYTFKIGVEKVDGNNTAKKLPGAEFDLYMAVAEGTEGAVNAADLPAGLTGTFKKVNATSLVTDADGNISVHGLKNGNYYLVETKAPIIDGVEYNLLKAPVEITIAVTWEVSHSESTDELGNVTETLTTTKFENAGDNGVFKIQVQNKPGFELPTTGGMGMFMFTIIGAVLMIGGAAVMFKNRKKIA